MPLRDDLLKPIEGANPSGADLRYAPVFDKIKEARRVEDDAPQGDWQRERKLADYKLVLKLASETLATKSKDLQLAAWVTEAALRQEGFAGLLQGLKLIRGLLENFWDTVYPEIEDGDMELRAAPVEWVGTKLEQAVRESPITKGGFSFFKYKESRAVGYEESATSDQQQQIRATKIREGALTPEDFDKDSAATPTATYEAWQTALEGCLEEIETLQLFGEEKFADQAYSLTPLRTAVEEIHHQIRLFLQKRADAAPAPAEPEPEPEAEPEQASYAVQSSGAAAVAAKPKRSVVGLDPADLDDASARLAAVAKFLRQQDAYSPGPYLLLRGYRWGELRGYGEYPDPTNLLPPPSEIRQSVKRLSLESNWSELLETAETAMAQPCGRAWLDLQRYVVRAADESGYSAIANAIRSELRALLVDLPALPTWTLMDDTPTANQETQAWLKEIAPPPAPVVEAAPEPHYAPSPMIEDETAHPAVPEGEPAPPDTFDLAMDAARRGRASEAIQMLADEIPRQRSGRARFQRKLQLAQVCMTIGHEALAQPILEELSGYIDAHKLEDWEASDVVAHPLVLLYRCLNKNNGDAQFKSRLYARISRLDPVQALECVR